MKPSLPFAALGLGVIACAAAALQAQEGAPLHVRHVMQAEINPAIMTVWDIGNAVMNEEGGIDPAQMDDAKWAELAEAAGKLEQSGRAMASAQTIKAAAEGNMATEEYEVTMAQVQASLDADPEAFRTFASGFAEHAAALKAAAEAKNEVAAGELVSQMDTVCAGCHGQFWYAE